MTSNLLVKLIFVLIKFVGKILLSLFDLFAQLLNVLCCLRIFNHLRPMSHYVHELATVNILAHVSKHWYAS
jgi:hypothetical protein